MPTASRSARSATARCGSTPTSATTGARTASRSSMASRSRPWAATRNFRACVPPMTGCRRTSRRRLDGAMVMQGQQYGVGRRIDVTLPLESTHHCRQPIFVTNPGSARKGLYVASQNSMWIEGMPRDESEALLQRLFEIAEDPAIIYEHVWRVGDLIMWDNLACLHARTDWPGEQRRTLRRCTVEGEPLY